jgi:hypothetical protein
MGIRFRAGKGHTAFDCTALDTNASVAEQEPDGIAIDGPMGPTS